MQLLNSFPEAVDNTIRTTWDTCQRKFLLEHIHHLRNKDPSIHLVFGAAYAKGLEVMRKEFYTGNNVKTSYMGKAFIEAIREWDKSQEDPLVSEVKSLTNMLCALCYYEETWPLYTDWLKPLGWQDEEPKVEFTFAIPLEVKHPVTGNPMLYTGRFDMFADYASEPAVYDDKTAMQLGPSWVRSWNMSSQMTGYIWAAQQHGFKSTTAIIRGVSILKKSFGNAQAIEHRQNWEISRWYDTLNLNLEAMIKAWQDENYLPSLGSGCTSYSGCPYMNLCKQHNWEEWIEPEYGVFIWNPLDISGDHKVGDK